MDKKTSFLTILGILVLPSSAFAQLHSYGAAVTPTDFIHNLELAIGLIFGAIVVVCFVISGILFLTAQGDPEKLKIARSSVIWGIVGVVVGILAFSIIAVIANVVF